MAQNKLSPAILAMAGISTIIIAAGSFGWYLTNQQVVELEASLQQTRTEHNRLQSRPNFPSQANLNTLQENNNRLEKDIRPSLDALAAAAINTEEISGTMFQSLFARTKQKLIEDCQNAGITIPENFQFGFSLYATNTPVAEDTAQLSKQLKLVENIVEKLIETRVSRIYAVRRMLIETSPPGGALDAATGVRAQNVDLDYIPPVSFSQNLSYEILPFVVEFESDESSLRRIVNHFSKPPDITSEKRENNPPNPYYVIRVMDIENSKSSLPTIEQLRAAAAGTATAGRTQTAGGTSAIPGILPGSIAPVIIVGNETIRVAMRIDYIGWKNSQEQVK